jgi:hypothetical protein
MSTPQFLQGNFKAIRYLTIAAIPSEDALTHSYSMDAGFTDEKEVSDSGLE